VGVGGSLPQAARGRRDSRRRGEVARMWRLDTPTDVPCEP
jgi:hypothetical protein